MTHGKRVRSMRELLRCETGSLEVFPMTRYRPEQSG